MNAYWKDGILHLQPDGPPSVKEQERKALCLIREALARLSVVAITCGPTGPFIEPDHDESALGTDVRR